MATSEEQDLCLSNGTLAGSHLLCIQVLCVHICFAYRSCEYIFLLSVEHILASMCIHCFVVLML